MTCDHCDKPATIHVTRVVDGKVKKVHLCEVCAQKLGVAAGGVPSVSDLLLGGAVVSTPGPRTCPACGMSSRRFRKEGRLGCPQCYETFPQDVERVFENIHYAVQHQGRSPRRRFPDRARERDIALLQDRLNQAISSEAFEDAARIRDELQSIKHADSTGD